MSQGVRHGMSQGPELTRGKKGVDASRARMATTLALAPAAGSGIGKLLAESLLADPEVVPLMVEAAKEGLRATRSFYVRDGNTGHTETEPDYKVRLQALALLLSHMEGEPVKRILHQHIGTNKAVDPLEALRESPATLAAVESLLAKAKFRERHKTAKPVETADIEV